MASHDNLETEYKWRSSWGWSVHVCVLSVIVPATKHPRSSTDTYVGGKGLLQTHRNTHRVSHMLMFLKRMRSLNKMCNRYLHWHCCCCAFLIKSHFAEFSTGFISMSIIFTLCHTSPVLAQSPPVSSWLLSNGFLAELTVSQPISTPLTSPH